MISPPGLVKSAMKSKISMSLLVKSVALKDFMLLMSVMMVFGATMMVEAKMTGMTEALLIFSGSTLMSLRPPLLEELEYWIGIFL